jgi:hypothetical protein
MRMYIYLHLYTYIHSHTRIWTRNIEDEECAHHEAHFKEELESLKTSVARL